MKLSEVRKNNEKFRIDGSYFSKTMLRTESIIHAYNNGHDTLGHVFSRFVKGIFDINANSYSGSGIPFLRILNLKNGVVATNNLALIPELIHQAEKKTELLCGDIVLSKTAYPAASLVTLERCNTSQDTIATTLSTFGKSYYFSEFIVAFLNCMYGKLLLTRQFQGNVQLHLALDDGRKVPIPRGTKYLQSCIKYAFKNATEYLSESKNLYAAAETLLLNTLGLADFTPNSEKVNIKSFQESFVKTGRLDAEYYQQKYEQLVEHILKKPHCKLADLVKIKKSIEPGSDAYSDNEEDLPFLRVADYDKFGMNTPQKKLSFVFVTDNQEKINALKPKKGTILFSKDGSIGQAYYLHEDGRFITSGAILHLNIKNKETIVPDYLTLVLNSQLVQMQAERDVGGSIILHWRTREIEQVLIPVIEMEKQKEIAALIQQSFMLKAESKKLLDAAKRAVEIAIEQDEQTAIDFLEKETCQLDMATAEE